MSWKEPKMDLQRFRKAIRVAAVAAATVLSVGAMTKVKLDSVAPNYLPTAGAEISEPVAVKGFAFEVNKETQRARVVVDYTYPDQVAFGHEGGSGPERSMVRLPGLNYDAKSHAVVY